MNEEEKKANEILNNVEFSMDWVKKANKAQKTKAKAQEEEVKKFKKTSAEEMETSSDDEFDF